MSLNKQAEDDLMTTLKGYLDKPYAAGVLGGVGGAALGGLATGPRRGENSRQRALRTVRNAMFGGLIGGGGAQLASSGLTATTEAMTGKGEGDKPGFLRSPLARLLGPLGINAGMQIGRKGREANTLGTMFRNAGEVHVDPANPNGGVNTSTAKTTRYDFRVPAGTSSKDHFKGLADTLRMAAKDKTTFGNVVDQLVQHGNPAGNPEEAKRYLHSLTDTSFKGRAGRLLFPGSTHFPAQGGFMPERFGGHGVSLGRRPARGLGGVLSLASMFAPDAINAVTNAVGGGAGNAAKEHLTFGGGKPSAEPNWLVRGVDPFAKSTPEPTPAP